MTAAFDFTISSPTVCRVRCTTAQCSAALAATTFSSLVPTAALKLPTAVIIARAAVIIAFAAGLSKVGITLLDSIIIKRLTIHRFAIERCLKASADWRKN